MFVTVLFIITPNQKHSDAHQLEPDKQTGISIQQIPFVNKKGQTMDPRNRLDESHKH